MKGSSSFIDIAAVEAWDAWFRWRQDGELRDLSIQDTWARVARTLSRAEDPAYAGLLERQLMDAMDGWRLLLDESLLATAGTDAPRWRDDELVAALNLAAFVHFPGTPDATVDWGGIEVVAELAVRALDNAAALAQPLSANPGLHMRIGVVGLADALVLMGERYDSIHARRLGRDMAKCLATGCLRGSLQLAHERGARCELSRHPALGDKLDRISPAMAEDAARSGLRHARLTAITSQRRLALLANNVADAVDPPEFHGSLPAIENGTVAREGNASGYAWEVLRLRNLPSTPVPALTDVGTSSVGAQMEMRAAMQLWIDRPITYPMPPASPQRFGVLV